MGSEIDEIARSVGESIVRVQTSVEWHKSMSQKFRESAKRWQEVADRDGGEAIEHCFKEHQKVNFHQEMEQKLTECVDRKIEIHEWISGGHYQTIRFEEWQVSRTKEAEEVDQDQVEETVKETVEDEEDSDGEEVDPEQQLVDRFAELDPSHE